MKLVMKKENGKKQVISTTAPVLGSCTVLSKIRIKVQFGDTSCTDFKRGIAFEVVLIHNYIGTTIPTRGAEI